MQSLYHISEQLRAIDDYMDEIDGDVSHPDVEAMLDAWMAEVAHDEAARLDDMAAIIAEITHRAESRKLEAHRLSDLASADLRAAAAMRDRIDRYMVANGRKKVQTDRFRISLRTNGGTVPLIVDLPAEELPDAYRRERTRTTVHADQDAIREALDSGAELDFARYGERGHTLKIA